MHNILVWTLDYGSGRKVSILNNLVIDAAKRNKVWYTQQKHNAFVFAPIFHELK